MTRLERLTEYRLKKGFKTAKAFAEHIGVSQSQISEMDKKEKPASLYLALSEKTDINLDWLETGEGDMYAGRAVAGVAETEMQYQGPKEKLSPEKQILWKLVQEQMTDDEAFEIVAEYKRRIRDQERK